MPLRPYSRGLSRYRREPVRGAVSKLGLPWDAYYVLTKAEARLTNSKIHPNSGSPNYNTRHDHTLDFTNVGTKTHAQIDTHISSNGTDHTYIDQDVQTTASPTFNDLTISTPSNIYSLSHDSFADYAANKHIDWTTATDDFYTTGSGRFDNHVGLGAAPDTDSDLYITRTSSVTTATQLGIFQNLVQDTASAFNIIGGATNANSTHTTGTMATLMGYFGGAYARGNGAVTNIYGVFGGAGVTAGFSPNVSVLTGIASSCDAGEGTVTFAISLWADAPIVTTGSIAIATGLYVPDVTTGTVSSSAVFGGDVIIASDKKLIMEGTLGVKGDTYLVYDSSGTTLDCFVNGTEMWNANSTRTQFLTGLVISSGTAPAPAEEGALFLDTDASANGDLVCYSNGAWRIVATL